MKRRLLDVSDCAASPMLGESRFRRQWVRDSWTSSYLVAYNDLGAYAQPKIAELTEDISTGTRRRSHK